MQRQHTITAISLLKMYLVIAAILFMSIFIPPVYISDYNTNEH